MLPYILGDDVIFLVLAKKKQATGRVVNSQPSQVFTISFEKCSDEDRTHSMTIDCEKQLTMLREQCRCLSTHDPQCTVEKQRSNLRRPNLCNEMSARKGSNLPARSITHTVETPFMRTTCNDGVCRRQISQHS